MGQGFMGQLLKLMPLPAAKRVGVQTKGPFPLSITNHINKCSSPPCAFHLWLSMYTNTWLAGPAGLRSWPAWWLGLGCLSFPFGSLLLTSQKTPWSQNRAVFICYLGHWPHVQQEWRVSSTPQEVVCMECANSEPTMQLYLELMKIHFIDSYKECKFSASMVLFGRWEQVLKVSQRTGDPPPLKSWALRLLVPEVPSIHQTSHLAIHSCSTTKHYNRFASPRGPPCQKQNHIAHDKIPSTALPQSPALGKNFSKLCPLTGPDHKMDVFHLRMTDFPWTKSRQKIQAESGQPNTCISTHAKQPKER